MDATETLRVSVPLRAYCRGKRIVLVRFSAKGEWAAWNLSDAEIDNIFSRKPFAIANSWWMLGGQLFRTPKQCLIAVFGEDLSKISMSLTDWQIVRYHNHPYMQHLTDDELLQRWHDVITLPVALTQDEKISLVPFDPIPPEMVKLADMFEECRNRYGGDYHPPGLTHEQSRSSFHWYYFQSNQEVLDLQRHLATLDLANTIVKFGKAEDMHALYEKGEVLLNPASEYDKSDMDGDLARQDDERWIETNVYKSTKKDVRCDDYWMFSVAKCTGNPIILNRLFGDFKAKACVVIHDAHAFFNRLDSECRSKIPNARRERGDVRYIDPLLDEVSEGDVPMSKHFKFMYQHESRYVAVPINEDRERLEPKKLELESLRDIATYIDCPG